MIITVYDSRIGFTCCYNSLMRSYWEDGLVGIGRISWPVIKDPLKKGDSDLIGLIKKMPRENQIIEIQIGKTEIGKFPIYRFTKIEVGSLEEFLTSEDDLIRRKVIELIGGDNG